MRRDVPVTSIECYDEIAPQRMTDEDRLLVVFRAAGQNLTLAEATVRFNAMYRTNKPESTISGRLNGLAHRVPAAIVLIQKRACAITGRTKQAWGIAPAYPMQLALPEAS